LSDIFAFGSKKYAGNCEKIYMIADVPECYGSDDDDDDEDDDGENGHDDGDDGDDDVDDDDDHDDDPRHLDNGYSGA